jgi:hypothetical protein
MGRRRERGRRTILCSIDKCQSWVLELKAAPLVDLSDVGCTGYLYRTTTSVRAEVEGGKGRTVQFSIWESELAELSRILRRDESRNKRRMTLRCTPNEVPPFYIHSSVPISNHLENGTDQYKTDKAKPSTSPPRHSSLSAHTLQSRSIHPAKLLQDTLRQCSVGCTLHTLRNSRRPSSGPSEGKGIPIPREKWKLILLLRRWK